MDNENVGITKPTLKATVEDEGVVFDVSAALGQAKARAAQIDAEIKAAQARKAQAQAQINKLREEAKTLARFLGAAKPRAARTSQRSSG
jgi:hypothetical protein